MTAPLSRSATDGRREESAPLTYAAAGVDIVAAEENVRRIRAQVCSTHGPSVLGNFGAFAGLFHLTAMRDPVLVASTDGVGSKLELAIALGRHEVLGRDLVNLSVNDVVTTGARPLFFLDYVAVHRLDHAVVEALVEGMAHACRENGCALLGGETAQLPDLYAPDRYDLAGFVVGVVERDRLLSPEDVRPGDRVWALPSTGLHTNGYTLARRIVEQAGLNLNATPPGLAESLGDSLLRPHPSYYPLMQDLFEARAVKSVAHVTGGGLPGNLPRALPEGLGVELRWGAWPLPPIFAVLQEAGAVAFDEMLNVFNLGIGMAFISDPSADVPALCPGALDVGIVRAVHGRERVSLQATPPDGRLHRSRT